MVRPVSDLSKGVAQLAEGTGRRGPKILTVNHVELKPGQDVTVQVGETDFVVVRALPAPTGREASTEELTHASQGHVPYVPRPPDKVTQLLPDLPDHIMLGAYEATTYLRVPGKGYLDARKQL